jgi:hypothetical protein
MLKHMVSGQASIYKTYKERIVGMYSLLQFANIREVFDVRLYYIYTYIECR